MLQMLLHNFYVWNKNNNYVFLDYIIHLYILIIYILIYFSSSKMANVNDGGVIFIYLLIMI